MTLAQIGAVLNCGLMSKQDPHSTDIEQTTDQSLMRRFRDGNDDAATAPYLRYAQRLHKLANHQVYEDIGNRVDKEGIVQSVFRTFFRRASLGQYDIADNDALWKLLLVIALNKIRTAGTYHRAARRKASQTRSLADQEPHLNALSSGESEALAHLQMTIDELIGRMPEDHRTIIRMRIDGHGIDEIASQSGRAKRTVERILQRFRNDLETEVDEERPK